VQELETGPLHRFRDWPNQQVPKRAAGVYTVWEGDRLLYVGMSGRAMTAEDLEVSEGGRVVAKGLWTRLNSHASGRRSGDQFCVYVCDRFAVPGLIPSQQQQLAAGILSLDSLIRAFASGWPTGSSSPLTAPRRSSWNERFGEDPCPPVSPISTHWGHRGRDLCRVNASIAISGPAAMLR
jgi:hypothetical protein